MGPIRLGAMLLVAAAALLADARPAAAHGASGLDATDHRAELLGLDPPVGGVRVRLVDRGTRIELDAGTHDVVVLGYEGEPYLRVGVNGVFENRRSPTTYLNRSLDGEAPPRDADADAEPAWRRVSDGPSVRWHDHALHVPPAQRAGARSTSAWERLIEIDGRTVALRGRIVTSQPPSSFGWVVATALIVAPLLLRGRRAWRAHLVGTLAVLVVADVARVYGLVFGPPTWLASRADIALDSVTMSLIGWGLAVAAIVLLAQGRRIEGAAAAVVAGAVLAVVGGVLERSDLGAAHLGSALPDVAARLSITLVLGAGIGAALMGLLELRRASSTSAPPAPRSGSEQTRGDGTRTASRGSPTSG